MSGGPTVTLAEAARRSHLSLPTVRRWLKDGRFPNAVQGKNGWSIPVAELVAGGAWKSTSEPDDEPETVETDRIIELERRLAESNASVQSLRAELSRADQNLDDLRTAMRALEAAPADRAPARRWWRRS